MLQRPSYLSIAMRGCDQTSRQPEIASCVVHGVPSIATCFLSLRSTTRITDAVAESRYHIIQ
ncbi:hypothetical protein MJ8_14180 [Mesorhizobium sp. J8]|nr:hypothetical protein MJ8_14180 [Mesorhizobium sp. J8]